MIIRAEGINRNLPVDIDSLPWFPEWVTEAACRFSDPQLFFPASCSQRAARAAKRICFECPVRKICLKENLEVPFGIFGGYTEWERRKIRGLPGDPHKEGINYFAHRSHMMIREDRRVG